MKIIFLPLLPLLLGDVHKLCKYILERFDFKIVIKMLRL